MTPLLDVHALHGGYGRVEVLRGVDLQVHAGEIVALLGSNGAGKTTLNSIVCGLVPASAGHVHFDGEDLTNRHYRDIVKAGLIQVPEGRRIFPNLSVRENLELGAFARARERRASNLERVFAMFPKLAERVAQKAGTMSGGEQQMLAIARALMGRPRLVLLDEPSLGLAPLVTQELFEILGDLNREHGLSMLIVEQNAGLALAIAARGYVLEAGTIAVTGPAAELADNDDVRRAYLGI